jgi:hypothetical protein
MTGPARDYLGNEIRVGDFAFIDRDRESFPVIAVEPFTTRSGAHWIKVDDPWKGPSWYFDIAVRIDERKRVGS